MKKSTHANQVLAVIRALGTVLTADTLSEITKLEAQQVRLGISALRQAGHPVHIIGHSKYQYDSSRPVSIAAPRGRSVAKKNGIEPLALEVGHLLEITAINGEKLTAISEGGGVFVLCSAA